VGIQGIDYRLILKMFRWSSISWIAVTTPNKSKTKKKISNKAQLKSQILKPKPINNKPAPGLRGRLLGSEKYLFLS